MKVANLDIGGGSLERHWKNIQSEASMFRKQGVCIATAAGAGVKSTLKDMADSLFFWGVARIYQYGIGVAATDWNGVNAKKESCHR